MKRRNFIKKTALAGIAAPYILPSGRLFASTGVVMADHVVFVIFAGGVRQQEATLQRYLSDSQGLDIEGNIMYNLLDGSPPENKIVYGTDTQDGQVGGVPIPTILNNSIQSQGTFFPEMRYTKNNTGHFSGLSTAVSGYYGTTQGLRQRPLHPTIFEYLRRYRGALATETWFVGNGTGNSIPLLNYSAHPDFGINYGANFLAPRITYGDKGETFLKDANIFHPEEELGVLNEMRTFLDQNFNREGLFIPDLKNTVDERWQIKSFIQDTFQRDATNQIARPSVIDNNDLRTISYATEVLKKFKPILTVINMNSVDVCHNSFTSYLQSLHRGDHGIGFLWNYIQNQVPEMSGKTVMIVMPEHGRNLESNNILDANDWFAFDHDGDLNSQRIFGMLVGPGVQANLSVGAENNPIGTAADMVPTIAEILGIKQEVMGAGLLDGGAMSLFDRI